MKCRAELIFLMLLAAPMGFQAQSPTAVPIPAQLAKAQIAFVANAGGPYNYLNQTAYKAFYQALSNSKHFQLATNPADAELAFELSISPRSGGLSAAFVHPIQLQLDIRDVKTQTLLWSLTEPINTAGSPTAGEIETAASKLVADYNSLISGTLLNESAPKKTRFSDERKK